MKNNHQIIWMLFFVILTLTSCTPIQFPSSLATSTVTAVLKTQVPTKTTTNTPTITPTSTLTPTPKSPDVLLGLPENYDAVPVIEEEDFPEYFDALSAALWKKYLHQASPELNQVNVATELIFNSFRGINVVNGLGDVPIEIGSWTKVQKNDGTIIDLIGIPVSETQSKGDVSNTARGIVFYWFNAELISKDCGKSCAWNDSRLIFDLLKRQRLSDLGSIIFIKDQIYDDPILISLLRNEKIANLKQMWITKNNFLFLVEPEDGPGKPVVFEIGKFTNGIYEEEPNISVGIPHR